MDLTISAGILATTFAALWWVERHELSRLRREFAAERRELVIFGLSRHLNEYTHAVTQAVAGNTSSMRASGDEGEGNGYGMDPAEPSPFVPLTSEEVTGGYEAQSRLQRFGL
jgi:hypothetical protein